MKIALDARFLTHPQVGGFKTYTESLVCALSKIDFEDEFILYVDREPASGRFGRFPENFQIVVVPAKFRGVGVPWREQVLLSWRVQRDRPDLLHSLCSTSPLCHSVPSILTLHDLIWHRRSQHRYSSNVRRLDGEIRYFRLISPISARKAQCVVVPSCAVRSEVVEFLNVDSHRVLVIPLAPSEAFREIRVREQLEVCRARLALPDQFILALGSSDKRKNISGVMEAYSRLPAPFRNEFKLVIVCADRSFSSSVWAEADRLGIPGQTHCVTRVTPPDLNLIYNLALVFVFPSFIEGFGLPPLEAMACGTPVIASSRPPIPEVLGDSAAFVEPEDLDGIATEIVRTVEDAPKRRMMRQKGFDQCRRFTWERTAVKTLQVYHAVSKSCGRETSPASPHPECP